MDGFVNLTLCKEDNTLYAGNLKTLTFVIQLESLWFWTNSLERI